MHNTGNPLPSKDILDLYDNSEVVDNFVNSQQDEVPDRFGTKRLTLAGLIKRSMALRNEINDFSGALTFKPEWSDVPMNVSEGVGGEGGALNLQAEALGNRSEINKITSREALRRTYLEVGLNLVDGSFEQGTVITSTTDVVLHEKSGKCYSGPIGNVTAGTDPAGEGFTDRSGVIYPANILNFPDFLTACMKSESLVISRDYTVGDVTIPSDAKIKTIVIENCTLRLSNYNLTFNLAKDLVLDLSNNGVIDCGLKKVKVAQDYAAGANVITVDDASGLSVGDHLTTSMLAVTGSKWANAIRVPGDAFNTITAISGNTLTMQYGVDAGFTLYRNTWLGNARFDKSGLSFTGSGCVKILGGEIRESRAGYWLSVSGSVEVLSYATRYSGQFLDGFKLNHAATIKFFDCNGYGSYDPSKQLVVWDSTGNVEFYGGKFHRGNFDVDIYHAVDGVAHGDLVVRGTTFDGTSLMAVKSDQVDTINGGVVGDHITYLGDSLHFHTLDPSGSIASVEISEGSEFLNYQRAVTGTTYLGARGNQSIGRVVIKDIYSDCPPFYYKKNSNTITIGQFDIGTLSLNRKYTANRYVLGYSEANAPVVYGGRVMLTPNGSTRTNTSIPGGLAIDELFLNGPGVVSMDSPTNVARLIVNTGSLYREAGDQANINTDVTLLNGGTVSGSEFNVGRVNTNTIFGPGDTTKFVKVGSVPNGGGYAGRLMLSPRFTYGGTAGVCADVIFFALDGVAYTVAATTGSANIPHGAYWAQTPIYVGGTGVAVVVKVVGGVVYVNANHPTFSVGLSMRLC
ncbi:hypothetical protein PQC65_gp030 [Aeromonas phage pAEv1810]|uniref:hypothetical protein n=1 Tax=Aeromonas phage pAEv1810 TaxID=2908744 RepID=UPI002329165A|nr:hypothetical protein PQC65_gp030 [Aeromonas phage pAEv1810]UIS24968.1 hypothetical protein pAEv1810_30 [Aeromonas phage pAEv1810]